jgi:hypothetical protein
MSMEMQVFFCGKLPNKSALQKTLKELGFPLALKPATGSLEKQSGYMPMILGREDETGVEFSVFDGREAVEECATGIDPQFDRVANFRWGGDPTEMLVAFICAAALAKLADGLVFEAEEGKLISIDRATAVARELLATTLNEQHRPGTRPSDIKCYLKPLLAMRSDLVLRGRLLLIRPVRHVIRGAFFDRTSDKYTFQIWRYFAPLYDERHGVGYSGDSLRMTAWESYFEPLLFDTLERDVFDRVAQMVTLSNFADQIAEQGSFMKARARALILAGERDRAAAWINDCERRWRKPRSAGTSPKSVPCSTATSMRFARGTIGLRPNRQGSSSWMASGSPHHFLSNCPRRAALGRTKSRSTRSRGSRGRTHC